MGSLSDLIKQKQAANKQEQQEALQEEKEAELAPYVSQYKYPEPDHFLFVAAWTPFLKNPIGTDTIDRRKYVEWLLAPSLYVLNTFEKCEEPKIFPLLHEKCRLTTAIHMNRCAMLIFDICLYVPIKYQQEFISILKGIEDEKIPA